MIVSTDPRYKSELGSIRLESGETGEIRLIKSNSAKEKKGPVYIRLISDHPDNPGILSLGGENIDVNISHEETGIDLEYYYTPDCKRCRAFLAEEIPDLEEELGISLSIKSIDVTTPAGLKALTKRLKDLNSRETKMPIIISGSVILAGDREIEKGLKNLIQNRAHNGSKTESSSGITAGEGMKLGLLPIIAAGLLDGINPCAFTTLIFLISWLGLAGRQKKEILLTGIFFTTAIFATYYLLGLGAFTAVRSSSSVLWIGTAMKYTMAFFLIILSGIHINDYRKVRAGNSQKITLQLSKERKKKLHKLIRDKTRKAGLFTGSIILGMGVTIYELGCTGQIYLPTLMYMAGTEKMFSAYILLGVYNLAFVIPLIIVFATAWKGTSSEKLSKWFSNNLGKMKILSALFFLIMAVLLLIL